MLSAPENRLGNSCDSGRKCRFKTNNPRRDVQLVSTRLIIAVALLQFVGPLVTPVSAWQPIKRSASVSQKQENDWAQIKTGDGALFVWNRSDIHFTLSIRGKEIKPLNDPEHIFFNVDGMVFQIQVASIAEFAPDAKEKNLDDKALLAAHRDWETKFLEGLLGKKLKVQVFSGKLSTGTEASLWQFDMPEGMNDDAKKQVYLTVVSKPYVLLLNSVATAAISDEVARKFLMDTMSTLKISPTPIDVKKLAESISKSAGS
jgi:hypothetical protein